jgi:hypothetical protein
MLITFVPTLGEKSIINPKLKVPTRAFTSSHPKSHFPTSNSISVDIMPIGDYSQIL